MTVLATWTPVDAALDALVPLGLVAASSDGGLVIDLDPRGPQVGHGATLADLVADGPTSTQLEYSSGRRGYLSNGGVEAVDAGPVIAAFVDRWPHVVLKCPSHGPRPDGAIAFLPLLPEPFSLRVQGRCVFQRSVASPTRSPDGPVLPIPRRATIDALFAGRRPTRRDKWLTSVGRLWA